MHDVPTEPIRLGDEVGSGLPTCVSDKSLHLDDSDVDGDAPNEPTPSNTNSPRTPSDDDEVLRVRSDSFHISVSEQSFPESSTASGRVHVGCSAAYSHSISSQGDVVNTETRDIQVGFPFHPLADRLNSNHKSLGFGHDSEQLELQSHQSTSPEQPTQPEQDTYPDPDHCTHAHHGAYPDYGKHLDHSTYQDHGAHPDHGTHSEPDKQSQRGTLSISPSPTNADSSCQRMFHLA
jgi:hypothetical protein